MAIVGVGNINALRTQTSLKFFLLYNAFLAFVLSTWNDRTLRFDRRKTAIA